MEKSKEFIEKKKEILSKVIDKKDDLSLSIGKQAMIDYISSESENELKVSNLLKGLCLNVFCGQHIEDLKKINKEMDECATVSELDSLESSIVDGTVNRATTTATTTTNTTTTTTTTETTTQSTVPQTMTEVPEHSDNSDHYEIDHFNINVSQKYREFYNQLKGAEKPDLVVLGCALKGYYEMEENLGNPKYLTVVDFTKPRRKKRFYVINMETKTVEHASRVGHGHNSGKGERATSFSNRNGSEQSNLGFLTTATKKEDNYKHTWTGLRMYGTEKDKQNNGNAASRGIFMHQGGDDLFSQGCFVLPKGVSDTILNKVIGGSLVFSYAKSKDYFKKSNYFSTSSNGDVTVA